jgi:hypothetical protein
MKELAAYYGITDKNLADNNLSNTSSATNLSFQGIQANCQSITSKKEKILQPRSSLCNERKKNSFQLSDPSEKITQIKIYPNTSALKQRVESQVCQQYRRKAKQKKKHTFSQISATFGRNIRIGDICNSAYTKFKQANIENIYSGITKVPGRSHSNRPHIEKMVSQAERRTMKSTKRRVKTAGLGLMPGINVK